MFLIYKLELAKNALENSKIPRDYSIHESNELLLKKQQTTIETLQKKIEELTACLDKDESINVTIPISNLKVEEIN